MEIPVPIVLPDLGSVAPTHLPCAVAGQIRGRSDVQPLRKVRHDDRGHVSRVAQEGAQKAHRAQLQGEPQSVVVAAPLADELPVGIVEVEVAGQLLRGWLSRVAAEALRLFVGQKMDGHRVLLEVTEMERNPVSMIVITGFFQDLDVLTQ